MISSFSIGSSNTLYGEITNIGSNKEISMLNLVRLISDLMGSEVDIIKSDDRMRPDKSEVDRLLCDNSKIVKHTGWRPQTTLKEGLTKTIEWVKKNQTSYNTTIYSV